ncbi:MFS transporter [Streptomyces sp. WG5]|uniref:MFS transporter n=1 Tax=Streptomyces sp. WG5 TaxID=3417648 RepID=UPI003CF8106B
MPQPTYERPSPQSTVTAVTAVTADTLVTADFRPRTRRRPPGPYRRLLAIPGARAFTVGNLMARLPMGMFSVSAVVMIADTRGSYALAGAVTATGLAATALVAPWTARLVDRHGQARVAVPATLVAALGSLALLLCVRYGAPAWTLFAAYAATATTPNTGGMARARWAHLLKDGEAGTGAGGDRSDRKDGKDGKDGRDGRDGRDSRVADALHTANSFEQAADELCFMLGPVLAAFLCTALFPEAGTLVGVVLLVSGMLLFTAQRSTEPPARPRPTAKAPFRVPGIPPLLVVCLAMGGVFGAMEVVTIAFADAQGHRAAAGVVLALQAAGSCAAGLLYGALKPAGPAERRLPWCVAAMTALLTLPLLAASLTGSLPLLALTLLVAGMATAPTMVTTMTLVQHRTPEGRLNEGMTLAVTGLLGGIACGSAAGGWTVEHASPTAAYGVPVTAAAVALLLALAPARGSAGRPRA